MTDGIPDGQRTPGVVIFVAILNFISASFAGVLALISLMVLIFGNIMGVADIMARQLSQMQSQTNLTYGVNFIFMAIFIFSLVGVIFFLLMGLGLLKGKKYAWFTQLAMSIIGLAGFPVATLLNGIILVLFFQRPVRDYFKV